jgi:D-sedoheptulose 7-phosphate isomerase
MMHLKESVSPQHMVATNYLAGLARTLDLIPTEALAAAVEMLLNARAAGRRVYIMGNGGSAATASHFACDLLKTAHVKDHAPLRVFALTDNTAVLTALANDLGYEHGFAEQIRALVEPGDVVVALSASGNSHNIVAGLTAASRVGGRTIGLFGFDGGAARDLVDVAIHIPRNDYGQVEDAHSAIGHAITAAIRAALLAHPGPPAANSTDMVAHADWAS